MPYLGRCLALTAVVAASLGLTAPSTVAAQPAPPDIEIVEVRLGGEGAGADRDLVQTAASDPSAPVGPGWSAEVELPNAAQMVGLTWTGSGDVELRLRSRSTAGWTPWVDLDSVADESPDPGEGNGRRGAGPAWIGPGSDAVGIEVVAGELADLRLQALEPTGSAAAPGDVGSAAAGAPPIVPRASWGAAAWAYATPGCEAGPRTSRARLAVIHHTVNTNTYSAAEAYTFVQGIQRFHIQSEGYCDIAYNFVVDRFGRTFEGRAGGADRAVVGGHARGFNTGTIGVALLGTHTDVGISNAAYGAMRDLLAWKFFVHGIDAGATVGFTSGCVSDPNYRCKWEAPAYVALNTIVTHRDVTATGCPGIAANVVPALRRDVARQVMASGPFHPQTGWVPDTARARVLTLDSWGGIHPAGSASTVPAAFGWPGYDIARGIEGNASGGYVVDGFGGLAAYGVAPPQPSPVYWRGWDIVRGLAAATPTSGYILDGWGGVHAYGGAPRASGGAYWRGWDIARDIANIPGTNSGYVLDGFGGVHAYGAAPRATGGPYWRGWDIARAVVLRPDGPGGYVLDGWGGLHSFGGAPAIRISHYTAGHDIHRDVVLLPGGGGYVVDADGFLWPVGSSPPLNQSMTWSGFGIGQGVVAG